jgi:hypothetical protein
MLLLGLVFEFYSRNFSNRQNVQGRWWQRIRICARRECVIDEDVKFAAGDAANFLGSLM